VVVEVVERDFLPLRKHSESVEKRSGYLGRARCGVEKRLRGAAELDLSLASAATLLSAVTTTRAADWRKLARVASDCPVRGLDRVVGDGCEGRRRRAAAVGVCPGDH